jgi:hypothetical protein
VKAEERNRTFDGCDAEEQALQSEEVHFAAPCAQRHGLVSSAGVKCRGAFGSSVPIRYGLCALVVRIRTRPFR